MARPRRFDEAQAIALSRPGHENRIYSLTGAEAVSFADIAGILSKTRGRDVELIPVSDAQYIANYVAEGIPEPVAAFALAWVHGTNCGEWGEQTGDLERLLGRKPASVSDYLRQSYPVVIPEIEALRMPKSA